MVNPSQLNESTGKVQYYAQLEKRPISFHSFSVAHFYAAICGYSIEPFTFTGIKGTVQQDLTCAYSGIN
jgi:hypothetical protein